MNLLEFFRPVEIAANWEEVASNQIPYLGAGIFTARKKAGLDLSWLKGSKGLPVSLMPSAFDAQATFRDRIGIEKIETEMPFFREGYKLKEKDRQDLLRIQESNDPYAEQIIARIFDDTNELIASADVVAERMRMQLLFALGGDVGIAIKANGVNYTYNYDVNGTWKASNYFATSGTTVTVSDWTNHATSDPLADIKKAKDAIRIKTGSELAIAIMNSVTFNHLAQSASLKDRYLTTTGRSFSYLTDDEVKAVVRSTLGIQIAVYDKMYKDESKEAHAFVPDNYVSLIPVGALGSTWYGTTPEEADLRSGNNAEVAIVNTGVAISRIVENHPVSINTFASEIVLPSFERMDEVALLNVNPQ